MEFRILIFLSILLFLSSGFTQTVDFSLNSEKEKLIIDVLNDACVDSWCEGAVKINFKTVTYDLGSKSYLIAASTVQDEGNVFTKNSISFQCVIGDRSLIYTLVNSINLYDSQTANAELKLFNLIDSCVDNELTAKLNSN